MGNVIRDPRFRRPKVPPKSLLLDQIQFLATECESRTQLLEGWRAFLRGSSRSCRAGAGRCRWSY
jgi:hypothetical protein